MVARTSAGADGVPNLGKVSRAAGGAYKSLSASGLREMSEELICAMSNEENTLTILSLTYDDDSLSKDEIKEIETRKAKRIPSILKRYKMDFDNVVFRDLKATVISVPGLTEDISQIVDGKKNTVKNRFITAPVGGDYNIDTILYCELPHDIKMDSLTIMDGEENFDGDLLKRDWSMKSPQDWLDLIKQGQPMSQGPKKFFDNYNLVKKALPSPL